MKTYDEINGMMTIECDTCSESVEFEADNFTHGSSLAYKDGWITTKINGEIHTFCCSECKRRYTEMEDCARY